MSDRKTGGLLHLILRAVSIILVMAAEHRCVNTRYERNNGKDSSMKRLIAFCLALILPCCAAWGETASFGGVSFDRNAAYIDLGEYAVGEKEFGGFISFLQEFPDLQSEARELQIPDRRSEMRQRTQAQAEPQP